MNVAVIVDILLGILLIVVVSVWVADNKKENKWSIVREHLVVAILVLVITFVIGKFISNLGDRISG